MDTIVEKEHVDSSSILDKAVCITHGAIILIVWIYGAH